MKYMTSFNKKKLAENVENATNSLGFAEHIQISKSHESHFW